MCLASYLILWEAGCSTASPPENKQSSGDAEETPVEETPLDPPVEEGMGGNVSDPPYDPCPPCGITPSVTVSSGDEIVRMRYVPDAYFFPDHDRCVQVLVLNTVECRANKHATLTAGERPASLEDDGQPSPGARLHLEFGVNSDSAIVTGAGTFREAQGIEWALELVDELPRVFLDDAGANNREATLNYVGSNSDQESKSFIVTLAVCSEYAACLL